MCPIHFITAPIEPHSFEPCPLVMTDPSEPATGSVEPSVSESLHIVAEEEDASGIVQQASSDEKMTDSESQGQLQQEQPPKISPVEETAGGKHPTLIERCSSLDDIRLPKHKVL